MPTLRNCRSTSRRRRDRTAAADGSTTRMRSIGVPDSRGLLTRTFVDVADTLVADFDTVEVLTLLSTRCVELFDLAAAGLLVADQQGSVSVAGSSDERMQLLELFELQHAEAPCLDCY